ncbi:4'-phosphopantetheinyl transferase superfamily protein [Clostridium estertheticum]|uniref:4'-phosphopantetheinyl transferase family protein n=1 Tax=Clostridium estertheticum TaxID=238834 RepID=UPI0013EE53FB|nr:4'-phosphopantetheinyl transferase superfamily protein [Clostridium estertheticum]MBZ9609075.1 4'-phosphopantetheinyl transferase superfamily protein [Clostridium estertheticum]
MLYKEFRSKNNAFLSNAVRKITLNFQHEENIYIIIICVANIHKEEKIPIDYLNDNEKEKYLNIKHQRRRESFLLGKLVSKLAIAEEQDDLSDIFVNHGIFNQPIVSGRDEKVTITHCGSIGVAVAFDQRLMLGIDIEAIDERRIEALRRITTRGEEALFNEEDITFTAFLTMLWTIKEAMSKVLNTGFTIDLDILEVKDIVKKDLGFISSLKNFSQFKAISVLNNEYVFTIVIPKKLIDDSPEVNIIEIISEII